jgi:hypothetical protein
MSSIATEQGCADKQSHNRKKEIFLHGQQSLHQFFFIPTGNFDGGIIRQDDSSSISFDILFNVYCIHKM